MHELYDNPRLDYRYTILFENKTCIVMNELGHSRVMPRLKAVIGVKIDSLPDKLGQRLEEAVRLWK